MKVSWWAFAYCYTGLLFSGALYSRDEGDSQPFLESEEEEEEEETFEPYSKDDYALLFYFFSVLDGHSHLEKYVGAPVPQPDPRALSYMMELYRRLTTKDGIPRTNRSQLYNTVRLFTPHAEYKGSTEGQVRGDLHLVELLYNLECVTDLERLIKSVLLYSLDESVSTSVVICTCKLAVKEDNSSNQAHYSAPHTMIVELSRRRVEINVTSFLQPVLASMKRSIRIAVNFTCLKDNKPLHSKWDLFNLALGSPSLVLYLNDTSKQAYHRKVKSPVWSGLKNFPFLDPFMQFDKASRPRRNEDEEMEDEEHSVSPYNFSQAFLFPLDECQLQGLWLEFNQLKWDRWIIAPERYNPGYCMGACPRVVRHLYGSPIHALVQNVIFEILDTSVPRPSCVPAEYKPLGILRLEMDGSIVYKIYEDMIATSCTCL